MKKSFIAFIILTLLLFSLAPLAYATDSAVDLSEGGGVAARLSHIENEAGYHVGTAEYNCYLFAKRVFVKLFEYGDDNPNISYHGDYDPATYTTQLVGRLYTAYRCSIDG
ncbi:MAG: hypothetical protein Q4B42_07965, partial [Oscillospiraceae bacterium]|nr:hypothetical protein [Oscillospiraceae bacterium]